MTTNLDASQAVELPPLPKPYTVASMLKCVVCQAPYEPARAIAPHAAAGLGITAMTSSRCKCGSNAFQGTVGYDSPSPAQFTADQLKTYARAAIAQDRAARAQAEPVASVEQKIAAALRQHGLTLLKTASGYEVDALGPMVAEQAAILEYTPGEWFKATSPEQMQAFFLSRLPAIREAAQGCGYAVGLHGSERRDFDLIAVPWRDGCDTPDALARALAVASCGLTRQGGYEWEAKPLGRITTSIPICWCERWADDMAGAGHIDLSVMLTAPTIPQAAEVPGFVLVPRQVLEGAADCLVEHLHNMIEVAPTPTASAPKAEGEAVSRSQKMRDAGYTARPSPFACDECGQVCGSVALLQAHKCAAQPPSEADRTRASGDVAAKRCCILEPGHEGGCIYAGG